MTDYTVRAHWTDTHAEMPIYGDPLPPMPYADACELMLRLRRYVYLPRKATGHVYLSVEPVSRWVR